MNYPCVNSIAARNYDAQRPQTCECGRFVSPMAADRGLDLCWVCLEQFNRVPCEGFNDEPCSNAADPRSEDSKRCAVCEYKIWLAEGPEAFLGTPEQFHAHVEMWRERAGIVIDVPEVSSPIYAKQERLVPTKQTPQPITEMQFCGLYAVGLILAALMFIH